MITGIAKGNIGTIRNDDLGLLNVSAIRVPRMLKPEKNRARESLLF